VPAPLGQILPLPDQLLLVYVWALRCPLCLGSLLMTVRSWVLQPVPRLSQCLAGELNQIWWSGISASLLLAVWRGRRTTAEVAEAIQGICSCTTLSPRPQRPCTAWLHPYLYRCFDHVPGVQIRRITGQTTSFIDSWEREVSCDDANAEPGETSQERPYFLYIHGGGWKGGHARMSPHLPLLQALAVRGWRVFSCDYRLGAWPGQIEDCLEALRFVVREATAQGRSPTVAIGGASAGGHLAALVALRAAREGLCRVDALLLFYPVLDPRDVARATARALLPFPPLRLRYGQSLLGWFFERLVLRDRRDFWNEADPLWQLDQLLASQDSAPEVPATTSRVPRTLIVHGTHDSVVPIEHSQRWLAALQARDHRASHALLAVPFGRHTFEIAASFTVEAVFDGVLAWLAEDERPAA